MKPIALLCAVFFLCLCPAKAQRKASCAEKNGPYTHIVKKGETLMSISRLYNVAVENLILWNKIQDPEKMQVCQKILLIPPNTYSKRRAQKDIRKPRAGILPLGVSNRYKNKIDSLVSTLYDSYEKDASGEIAFYISGPYYTDRVWFYPETHFRNIETELDNYTRLLVDLDSFFRKPYLSKEDKTRMLVISATLRRYTINPVHADGSIVEPHHIVDPLPAPPYMVYLSIKVYDTVGRTLDNSIVYLIRPRVFETCDCKECLFDYKDRCDINDLKEVESQNYGYGEKEARLYPGPYHIFVTQQAGPLEKIVHYEKRKITKADKGKTIALKISGN